MATIKDIAQRSGVNISTASRALNGKGGVSQKTLERVRKAAEELNYTPNLSARIIHGMKSHMIGFIVPEIISNYFARIVSEAERRLQARGYSILIVNTQFSREKEIEALNTFCRYSVDGIFLACTIHQDVLDQFKPILRERETPLVLLEARLHSEDYNYIMIDDEAGMVRAISYLMEKGHRRVGFLSDPLLVSLRNDQFLSAAKRCGLGPEDCPIYTHPSKRFDPAGYEVMQTVLADPNRPVAFLAGYDNIAIGAMRAAEEAGLRIPEDFAVIGNDNIRESQYLHKSLTTLSPPLEKMAETGVDILLQCVEEKDLDTVHRVTMVPELIIREST